MKYIFRLIVFFVCSQFFISVALADIDYQVRTVQVINGNFLDIDIQIMNTGTTSFVLSTSSFFLNFPTSPARFNSPTKIDANDGPWDAQTDADYNNVLLTSDEVVGYIGLTVEFAGGSDNTGTEIPTSVWTTIGTIRLTITDMSQTSSLTWRSIGSVTQVARLTNPGTANGGSTDITSLGTFLTPVDAPLPVELTSFTASVNGEVVNLKWQTATEVDNYGFDIERRVNSQQSAVGSQWEKIGFVKGAGNSNSPKFYSFTDKDLTGGTKFKYRLKQIDTHGKFEYSNEEEIEIIPVEYSLSQNYPNPFNPTTSIKFNLPQAAKVTLNVYNILGEQVVSLVNQNLEAGFHSIPFNASALPSGTYIYRLQADKFVQTKKMILLK